MSEVVLQAGLGGGRWWGNAAAAAQLPPTPTPATPQHSVLPHPNNQLGSKGLTGWTASSRSLTRCSSQMRTDKSVGGRLDVVGVSRDGWQGQNLPGLSCQLSASQPTSSSLGLCLPLLASLCFPPCHCLLIVGIKSEAELDCSEPKSCKQGLDISLPLPCQLVISLLFSESSIISLEKDPICHLCL